MVHWLWDAFDCKGSPPISPGGVGLAFLDDRVLLLAQVFGSTGLEIVTQTRVEHLPETEKHKQRSINPLQDFLGAAQDHSSGTPAIEAPPKSTTPTAEAKPIPSHLTMEEYFTAPVNKEDYDGESRGGGMLRGSMISSLLP